MALEMRNGNGNAGNGPGGENGVGGTMPRPFMTCYDTDAGIVLIVAKRASLAVSAEGPAIGMLSFSESYGGDVSGAYDPGMESDTDVDVDEILPFDGNLPSTILQPLEFVQSHKASHKTQLMSPVPHRQGKPTLTPSQHNARRRSPPKAGTPPPSPMEDVDLRPVDGRVLEKAVEVITKPQEQATPFVNLLPDNRSHHFEKTTAKTQTTKTTTTVEKTTKDDSPVESNPAPTPVKLVSRVVEAPRSPPMFTKFLNNCRVREGQPAKFDVTLNGSPKPEIRWYRNGQQLNNGQETKIIVRMDGSSSLIIPRTTPRHSGTLTCKAENIAGLASCTAKLTVEG